MQRTSNIMRIGLAVAALALTSNTAIAQGGGGRGRGGPPVMNPDQPAPAQNMAPAQPMMPPARSPAEMVLRQRERLQLTDDQAKRLETLATSQRDALKPQRANLLRARADMADAVDKENLDMQRSALEKMAKIRIDRMMAMRKAMKETHDILTPEQRDKLPRPMMMRRMSGRGRGGAGMGAGMMQAGRGMGGGRMGSPNVTPPNASVVPVTPPRRPPTD